MNEIEQLCARLFARGVLRRDEARELEHPQTRAQLEARLNACGLSLATSAYSDHYGLRLSHDASDATVLDAATNLELKSDACALLTVLWARLALQQRTVEDSQDIPMSQPSLLPHERAAQARSFTASVRFETLVREFGPRLGGRTRVKGLLGQLRRLGFVTYNRLDDIQAGPLLELAIDGEQMVDFIRSRVLGDLLSLGQSGSNDLAAEGAIARDVPPKSVQADTDKPRDPSKRAAGGS